MTVLRAVITGMGPVAPNGIGREAFWEALSAGKSGVDWIAAFDPSPYACKVAGEVRDFDVVRYTRSRALRQAGRFAQMVVAAARLAVEDAGLDPDELRSSRQVQACIGNALSGAGDVYDRARAGWERFGVAGIPRPSAGEFAAHAAATHVSAELGITGRVVTMASACSTGLDVFQGALGQIQSGQAAVVLVGSSEAPISEFCYASFSALDALSTFDDPPLRASRPFDARRAGLVLGEGAAVCVVEELAHAQSRGAHVYAELRGAASANDGHGGARPRARVQALSQAIDGSLASASLSPAELDYVNAHGNSMVDYDLVDTQALRTSLGEVAYRVPVSSIKSMIGHAMGAAGSLQVVATCLAIERGVVPPTINYEVRDPGCDLDYVPNVARVARVRSALVTAHAIGGTYSSVVLTTPRM